MRVRLPPGRFASSEVGLGLGPDRPAVLGSHLSRRRLTDVVEYLCYGAIGGRGYQSVVPASPVAPGSAA